MGIALQAIQVLNGVTFEGKTLTVKPANSNEPSQTPTNNIYVKGLPISFSKQNLEAMFSRFGPILESRILTDIRLCVWAVGISSSFFLPAVSFW
jgi:RNA recognition motif-containing protein